MRLGAAGKMMPPDYASEAAPFADANDIDELLAVEDVYQNAVAGLDQAVAVAFGPLFDLNWNFAHELYRRQIVLAQMPASRLGQARLFHKLDQPDLCGNVAVFGRRLMLRDYARTSLQYGRGMNVALVVKELRHADFLAENSSYFCHCLFLLSANQLGRLAIGWGLSLLN